MGFRIIPTGLLREHNIINLKTYYCHIVVFIFGH